MDPWLAELEMVENLRSLIDHPNIHHESEPMETTFDYDQLAVAFHEDFYLPLSGETYSPEWYLNFKAAEFSPLPCVPSANNNNNNNNNPGNDNVFAKESSKDQNKGQLQCPLNSNVLTLGGDHQPQRSARQRNNSTKKSMQEERNGSSKRRKPSQVYDHIMAERKRRELLSQLFIALSAIIPGLKKVDKTSILGEAIKHMKELQEKINALEATAAKNITRSMVVIKDLRDKEDYGVKDNDYSRKIGQNCSLRVSGGSGGDGDGGGHLDLGPRLEIKATNKTLLLRMYCEKQKGILAKLFAELEKHHMTIVSSNVETFERLALDITIMAQIEKDLNKDLEDLHRELRAALLS